MSATTDHDLPATPTAGTRRAALDSDTTGQLAGQLDLALPTPRVNGGARAGTLRAVKLNGRVFTYRLRRSSRRTIALQVDAGSLWVSAPRWVAIDEIEHFMREKARWIVTRLAETLVQPARFQWQDGARLAVFDRELSITLDADAVRVRAEGDQLRVPARLADAARLREAVIAWIRDEALRQLTAIAAERAPLLGVAAPPVRLSNARTRWGSCSISPAGVARIRLNWRLALVPRRLADYVVVHELAHLHEMNHSARFWQWVERGYPEHRAAERELREVGRAMPPL
jgi:predicted metal-dependent hydrolase